ncbi:MAG: hypothetical protein JW958_05175 [Candidatus Eisenbacteria bacterium]|nr:hypothetical protein [Candidatus Eisenbacteria bacterium]
MRRVLYLLVLMGLFVFPAFAGVHRHPPAPDDLFDPDLIELDLDAIIAEKEKLFSVAFYLGSSQKDLSTSETQARNIASVKTAYDALAIGFQDATGIDISWQNDAFEGVRPVLDFYGNFRYKLPESVRLPGLGGRIGLQASAGRTGTSDRFSEKGFGAAITDEAYQFTGDFLYYIPGDLSRLKIIRGVERRELYVGFGMGYVWGRHIVEVFAPDLTLQGIGTNFTYEADGNAVMYQFLVGGDEYITPFLSISYQLSYRLVEVEDLKYNDVDEILDSPILIGEEETATTWDPWFPEDMWPPLDGSIEFGWSVGEDPIKIDFSGVGFQIGLRYHF